MPIRRYLRVSKYTVLETRIYLDNPSLLHTWLLHPRDPALPKVIESVRPLVLPKLKEEIDRAGAKKKKGGIKDVVVSDDFEVSIFLTEGGTRHAVMTKMRTFLGEKKRLKSTSSKLLGGDGGGEQNEGDDDDGGSIRVRQESEEAPSSGFGLADIPAAPPEEIEEQDQNHPPAPAPPASGRRKSTRKRKQPSSSSHGADIIVGDSDDNNDNGDDGQHPPSRPRSTTTRRNREKKTSSSTGAAPPILINSSDSEFDPSDEGKGEEQDQKDDKKLNTVTTYEGFSLYGRVLCLVVKRKPTTTIAGTGSTSLTATAATSSKRSPTTTTTTRGETLILGQGRREEPASVREVSAEGHVDQRSAAESSSTVVAAAAGSGMLEDWITMTQMATEGGDDGED